jgi:hypothetical protein
VSGLAFVCVCAGFGSMCVGAEISLLFCVVAADRLRMPPRWSLGGVRWLQMQSASDLVR